MRGKIAVLMTIAGLLSGCGAVGANSPPETTLPEPTRLKVVSHNPLHQPLLPVDMTLSNEETVHQLWADVQASHQTYPTGTLSCPNDTGVTYDLTFQRDSRSVLDVKLDPSGCSAVWYHGHTYVPTTQLLKDLSHSLHLDSLAGQLPTSNGTSVGLQPTKIVVDRDGTSTTITNPQKTAAIASAINQAMKHGTNRVTCQAMSNNTYTITLYYDSGTRSFTNHGGACQPLRDNQTGAAMPFGTILNHLT